MEVAMIYALLLGIVAGLRVFTGAAVWFALLGSGIWRVLFPLAAIGEYIVDAMPNFPARTRIIPSLSLRIISGGFAGWLVHSRTGGSLLLAILLGVLGALIGTFGGYRVRMWLIDRIGGIPAAILEDLVAIGLAVLIITKGVPAV